jgi:hypothetical protein
MDKKRVLLVKAKRTMKRTRRMRIIKSKMNTVMSLWIALKVKISMITTMAVETRTEIN